MSRVGRRQSTKAATRLGCQRATKHARTRAAKTLAGRRRERAPEPFDLADFVEVERPTADPVDIEYPTTVEELEYREARARQLSAAESLAGRIEDVGRAAREAGEVFTRVAPFLNDYASRAQFERVDSPFTGDVGSPFTGDLPDDETTYRERHDAESINDARKG